MFFFKPKLNILALDIGDSSIEALMLQNNSPRFFQRVELPENIIADGAIVNEADFISALSVLAENYKKQIGGLNKNLTPTALSLPESKVFIHCFDLELKEGDDLEKNVQTEAEKNIPWQEQEMYSDFISKKDKDIWHIVYVAAPQTLINSYKKAFASAGLELVAITAESFALGRALLTDGARNGAAMILDIGARATNISVFDKNNMLALSVTVPIAGQNFSASLARDKGLALPEAEIFKKKGDDFFTPDGKTAHPSLSDLFKKLAQEIEKAIAYFEKKTKMTVDEVILAGGSALLKGIDVFLNEKLNKKVVIGNPLKKISNPDVFKNGIAPILFADVIGQALSAEDKKTEKINLL